MNGEMQDCHTGSHEAHADLKVRPVSMKERSFSHGGELQLVSGFFQANMMEREQ